MGRVRVARCLQLVDQKTVESFPWYDIWNWIQYISLDQFDVVHRIFDSLSPLACQSGLHTHWAWHIDRHP